MGQVADDLGSGKLKAAPFSPPATMGTGTSIMIFGCLDEPIIGEDGSFVFTVVYQCSGLQRARFLHL